MATRTKTARSKRFKKLEFFVPIKEENAGKPADVRKKNAEREFKQVVFPRLKHHEFFDITSMRWRGPIKPQMKKYHVTVGLKRNHVLGPPSDPKVAQPKTPPPSA